MTPPPGQPDDTGPVFNAMAGSWVGAQIGWVNGNVYLPGADAPPEEQFAAGVRELNSNNRLSALRYLGKAFEAGRTPERAYYLMLAILSDQPYELLSQEHMELLRQTAAFAHEPGEPGGADGPDAYRAAVWIICQLLILMSRPPETVDADGQLLSLFSGIDALPAHRRSEILQHLQMITNGVVRDRLDAWDAAEVQEQRRAGNRETRALKFFIPDPVAPKQRIAAAADLSGVDQAALAAAAAMGILGSVLALTVLFRGSTGTAFLVLLTCGPGGAAAVRYGMERRWLGERLADENRRHFPSWPGHQQWRPAWGNGAAPFDPAVVPGAYRIAWPSRQYSDFHTGISKVIANFFDRQLHEGEDRSAWTSHSAGIRLSLANELTIAYGGTNSTSGLEWLVRMHAEETAGAWRSRTLFAYQQQLNAPPQVMFAFVVGVVSFGIGALLGAGGLLSADAGADTGFLALLLLAGAGLRAIWSGSAGVAA
ncbi:hypothetical protein ACFV23_01825, partial [Streptomyces sp. NPDC059627]